MRSAYVWLKAKIHVDSCAVTMAWLFNQEPEEDRQGDREQKRTGVEAHSWVYGSGDCRYFCVMCYCERASSMDEAPNKQTGQ